MAAEARLKNKVQAYLKRLQPRHKLWFYKVHGSGRQKMGIPDLCIIFYGVPIYIELKAPGEEATRIQLQRMKEIEAAGGYCAVADNVERVRQILLEAWDDHWNGFNERPELEPVKTQRAKQ